MTPNIDWKSIKTVLLDMDGTLLDLHFDNYFWHEYLPQYWGNRNNISTAAAKAQLESWYQQEAGTLSWYCIDFWDARLKLDLLQLKQNLLHLIKPRPYAIDFLTRLNQHHYTIIMVTNAHEKLLELKLKKTGINTFFDQLISAHALGHAKEELNFWTKLQQQLAMPLAATILIDDNLAVLRAAQKFGIKNLLTITQPDSRLQPEPQNEFQSIDRFDDIVL